MWKRYIVEIGTGLDLHGLDVTKAAKKAVKDAVSHSCLCGVSDIFGIKEPEDFSRRFKVDIKTAAPFPDQVDRQAVREELPLGQGQISVQQGGLAAGGLHVDQFGEGDQIVVVNAALTVYIDTEE